MLRITNQEGNALEYSHVLGWTFLLLGITGVIITGYFHTQPKKHKYVIPGVGISFVLIFIGAVFFASGLLRKTFS